MATETKKKSKADEILSQPYKLILHNDDYNTFDHVIECLIKICGHQTEQANQCAHLVHFKGECDVKYGSREKLEVMKDKLDGAGLLSTLESN